MKILYQTGTKNILVVFLRKLTLMNIKKHLVCFWIRTGTVTLPCIRPFLYQWLDSWLGSTRDNRVFNGPLGRTLRSFAHSTHSFCIALLCYTCFARSLCSWAGVLFSCGHATLYEALSVSRSVGRLVGRLVGRSVRRGDRVEKWENAHFRPCPPVRN